MESERIVVLEKENQRLQRAVQELAVLNELSSAIGGVLDTEEVIETIVKRSMKAVGAEQGTITLVSPEEQGRPIRTFVRGMETNTNRPQFHVTQAIVGWMLLNHTPLAVADPTADERFQGIAWDPAIRSLVSVPLMVKSKLTGILTLYNKKSTGGFEENDQRLLSIIAGQSAQIIENARLYEEEKAFRKMQEQVRLAAEVQRQLLPSALPAVPNYDIAGTSVAAQLIGGDYFDVIQMSGDRWVVCLGDVSGKGLPASLLMANVQATIRLLAMLGCSPGEAMGRANDLLVRCTPPEKFVTFFFAILDTGQNRIRYCNAGHNPPLFIGTNGTKRLETKGLVLGMFEGFAFTEAEFAMEPGDVIVLFSDGVTEAVDPAEEEFGEERLVRLVTDNRARGAAEISQKITDAVAAHAAGCPQHDDITLVALKRIG